MEGRLRDCVVGVSIELGRTVGDRSCGGGSGVVGEAGCDAIFGWNAIIEVSRSMSRRGTGRMKVSPLLLIDGREDARGWTTGREERLSYAATPSFGGCGGDESGGQGTRMPPG